MLYIQVPQPWKCSPFENINFNKRIMKVGHTLIRTENKYDLSNTFSCIIASRGTAFFMRMSASPSDSKEQTARRACGVKVDLKGDNDLFSFLI